VSAPALRLAPLLLPVLLAACGQAERLARVGRDPPLSELADPTRDPNYRPVTMPGPGLREALGNNNSLWRPGSRTFLRDQRASQVGDLITVLVSIQDAAQLNNRTQRARVDTDTMGIPQFFGLQSRWFPSPAVPATLVQTSGAQTTDGDGKLNRTDTVNLRLAATITQVLPNGNYVLSGKQEVRVNAELRELALQGVIRPQDIASDNTIRHDRLAEARILYGGRGTLSDLQKPRMGSQLLDIFLPF
jgi:flagellar L-ring protein precursor FlgH